MAHGSQRPSRLRPSNKRRFQGRWISVVSCCSQSSFPNSHGGLLDDGRFFNRQRSEPERTLGKTCRVCGNSHGLIRKYGLMCCRLCFCSNAKDIGFIKVLPLKYVMPYLSGSRGMLASEGIRARTAVAPWPPLPLSGGGRKASLAGRASLYQLGLSAQ
ncbi:hypothetical protein D1007_00582 [Hordeum vulgare]|nr:hypothetical protein D1007_00582 [Hordeum vulgare]